MSTGTYERDVAMPAAGNEIYYGIIVGNYVTILVTYLEDGLWTQPEVASFASDPEYLHFEPSITADGKRLFFLCTRPRAGEEPQPGWTHQNIWVVDRNADGTWGEPYDPGEPINTENNEFFPSVTRDGTLYFTRSTKGTLESAIYRSRLVNGKYVESEKLPQTVNGDGNPYNSCIAPDESYLLACVGGRSDNLTPGFTDYYVYFRTKDDRWSKAVRLGDKVNRPDQNAISPFVSPDGKYLFFAATWRAENDSREKMELTYGYLQEYYCSPQNSLSDIYWIDVSFIEELRPEEFK